MVAALAGVSRSTVSRVVNASPRVTPGAISAVTAAIEALGYVPNQAARSLASRKTYTIAVIIPENTAKFFSDPYFASVIHGVATHLANTEYTLTLLIASEAHPEKTRRYLQGGSVDGALILSHHADDSSYLQLSSTLPVVFGGRPMNDGGATSSGPGPLNHIVDVDNVAASSTATRYLLEHGRRRIATIAGPQNMAAGFDRLVGWRAAIAQTQQNPDLVVFGDFTPPGGEAAMRELLARGESFDGIFIASSQMAFGALRVLREHGLTVPGDVAITTVDNDYFAQNSTPPLTCIEQPVAELGVEIAQTLVRLINGDTVDELTVMPTRLIERESV